MAYLYDIDLQLLGEGEGSNGSSPAATADGDLSNVVYGRQTTSAPAAEEQTGEAPDLDKEFEELIKGKYKEQYGKRVSDTVQTRLKSSKDSEAKLASLDPMLKMLGGKYGVDASDYDALSKAIMDDDSYYEQEAMDKGLTVQQLKAVKSMERENAQLRAQMESQAAEQRAQSIYDGWLRGEEEAKAIYPGFSLEAEMESNPKFVELLRANVDVKTAYEVCHMEDIVPAAMQQTASEVKKQMTNAIAAGQRRPNENGVTSKAAVSVKNDVTKLTKKDRAEIEKRVRNGEKISF